MWSRQGTTIASYLISSSMVSEELIGALCKIQLCRSLFISKYPISKSSKSQLTLSRIRMAPCIPTHRMMPLTKRRIRRTRTPTPTLHLIQPHILKRYLTQWRLSITYYPLFFVPNMCYPTLNRQMLRRHSFLVYRWWKISSYSLSFPLSTSLYSMQWYIPPLRTRIRCSPLPLPTASSSTAPATEPHREEHYTQYSKHNNKHNAYFGAMFEIIPEVGRADVLVGLAGADGFGGIGNAGRSRSCL